MKNKKFLLFDMVKIGLLCAVIGFSTMHAMDLPTIRKNTTSQVLTFKSLEGLPCFSLRGINRLWEKFPEHKKQKITQLITDSNDERIVTLFNVATQLPRELHIKIVSWLFKGDPNRATFFMNKPVMQLHRCIFSQQVMDGKKLTSLVDWVAPESHKLQAVCDIDTIFEHLDDMVILDTVLQRNIRSYVLNRKELTAVSKVLEQFPHIQTNNEYLSLSYVYRDAYTASNMVKNISVSQLWGLIILGMSCVSACIEQKFCNKVLMQYLVEQNRRNDIKNEALMAKFQETGEQFLLEDQYEIVDPLRYSWFDCTKMISPHILIIPSCVAINETLYWNKSILEALAPLITNKVDFAVMTAAGMMFSLIFKALLCGLSYVSPMFDDRIMVHCSFLGAYVLGCVFYNLWDMSMVRNKTIGLKDIPQLLHNKNVVIE